MVELMERLASLAPGNGAKRVLSADSASDAAGPLSRILSRACRRNPVCCATALATFDLVKSTYLTIAGELGRPLKQGLCRIAGASRIVPNVPGLGLLCAADVVNRRTGEVDPKTRRRLLMSCFEHGRRGGLTAR